MKHIISLSFMLLAGILSISAQDPAVTDSDKYKVILDNEQVRVLDYKDKPGDKTQMHKHPDFIIYALNSFKRKLTFPDGKSIVREFKKGDIIYQQQQSHIGENIGNTESHALIVELKKTRKSPEENK